MGGDPRIATARLTIDLDALAANYHAMAHKAGAAKTAAVVKADGYGTGLEQAARALAGAGCDTFFVAVPEEGLRLRALLPRAEIFVFSGVFDDQSTAVAAEGHLIPVLNTPSQIELWAEYWRARGARRPCAIHIDTGMNRLGLSMEQAMAFAEANARDHRVTPILVMSHLACADRTDHPLNRRQLESFQAVAAAFEGIESSLANSAGVLLGPDYHFDMVRPGIALYGGAAMSDTANAMRPVVTAEARILQLRRAGKGETVGYGAAATLARDTVIAIAGAGYADGYHRAASGAGVPLREAVAVGGQGWLVGHRVPVLGRVTMDLTAFDVTDMAEGAAHEGDWIELFGPNIALDEAARAAGTIGYELLTGLGRRAARQYIGGPA